MFPKVQFYKKSGDLSDGILTVYTRDDYNLIPCIEDMFDWVASVSDQLIAKKYLDSLPK
jgi:hypothetical protein